LNIVSINGLRNIKFPFEQLDCINNIDILNHFDAYCGQDDETGNRAFMRLGPIPLFFYRYPKTAAEYSGLSALLTRSNRKAYNTCCFYGALIVTAIEDESKADLLHHNFYKKT